MHLVYVSIEHSQHVSHAGETYVVQGILCTMKLILKNCKLAIEMAFKCKGFTKLYFFSEDAFKPKETLT